MKRLVLFLLACVTACWGYRQLRSHPRTASKLAELERQSQRIVNQASDVVRLAKDQGVGKAADAAGGAVAAAQGAIGTAAGKAQGAIHSATGNAHEALDTAAQKARETISPFEEKVSEVRGDALANTTEPSAQRPAN